MADKFKPAHTYAQQYGIKAVIYGPPGVGKTPLMNTAPNPALFFSETGMLTMRKSNIPAWQITSRAEITDALSWLAGSGEAAKYDTFGFDSISQMAEIILTDELKKNKDGRKAYGEMGRTMMDFFNWVYLSRGKNFVLLAKQGSYEEGGVHKLKPYFPGQDLNIKVPHLFDEVFHFAEANIPNVGRHKALRTIDSPQGDILARDRSMTLSEYEKPDLSYIFSKINQGLAI